METIALSYGEPLVSGDNEREIERGASVCERERERDIERVRET